MLYVAVVEDWPVFGSPLHQFVSTSAQQLTLEIAVWCRRRWAPAMGDVPDDDEECVREFFKLNAGSPGYEIVIHYLEPIAIDKYL